MKVLVSIFFLCVIISNVSSYKILGVFHLPCRSHHIVGNALMKGLARAGHEVTIITAFKEKDTIENYEEIYLENSLQEAMKGKKRSWNLSNVEIE